MADEMSLAVFDPIKAVSADLEKKDAAQEFDHATPEGEKALRSWVHRVRLHKGAIEKVRVATKAVALDFGHKVDDLARELTLSPQKIIAARMKPLDDIEDAKRKAAEAIVEAERVETERVETERLADLKRREDEVARKEAEQKAAEDAANTEQREAERVEREKGIAEAATAIAEAKAETDRQYEAGRAEKKARQEAQRIKDEAAKIAADLVADEARIKAEALAKQEREAKIEAKRVADVAHREEIHAEIRGELWEFLTGALADKTVEALVDGKIPHVTINY